MKDNLILIGMPGAGKSTVGVVLAKTLAMDFLDCDLVICQKTGKTLQEIIDREGQEAFLALEEDIVSHLTPSRTVIAPGGSVPMEERAMAHLKEIGTVIYLKVSLEELRRRLSNLETRGIAFAPGQTLADLYALRTPVYEKWADLTVEADPGRNNIETMVMEIRAALEKFKC